MVTLCIESRGRGGPEFLFHYAEGGGRAEKKSQEERRSLYLNNLEKRGGGIKEVFPKKKRP